MISVDSLVRRYGDTVAVDGISFQVSPREVVGFLGPNGAGKTTTIKVLTGYLQATAGRVTVADMDIAERPLECRQAIGYLPENNPLYEDMEVSEYLQWSAEVRGLAKSRIESAIKNAAGRCGLGSVIGKEIGRLSKGYRQRVGLAAAILHDPPILLLDEPTSGLDPNQAAEVRALIAELKREKTVLLSSHILSEVKATCDRVIIVHRGRIAAEGTPAELEAGATGGQRVRLVLAASAPAEAVEAELARLPGVELVVPERVDGELGFLVSCSGRDADLRDAIYRTAAKKDWPLLELYREGASLEDVFRSLTA